MVETPLDKLFDETAGLSSRPCRRPSGDATATEWLRSPIIYLGDENFRHRMLRLAASFHDPVRAGRYYLHASLKQREGPLEKLALRRVFYALRPAVTLLWMRTDQDVGVPPRTCQPCSTRLSLAPKSGTASTG